MKEVALKLFRKKAWRPIDIGLLKWGVLLLGMVIGALLADFVRQNIWAFIAIGLLFLVRPTIVYFRDPE
jgi:hypothetical protein